MLSDTVPQGDPLAGLTETPEELIRACVNWLKSQPPAGAPGVMKPASIGFILSRSVPKEFGPGVAVATAELVYAQGNLDPLGDAALRGPGRFQSSINNFQTTETLWVQLALPNALSIDASGSSRPDLSAETPVELHHDVLVGIEPTPFESTSSGAVVTVMLWGIAPLIIT